MSADPVEMTLQERIANQRKRIQQLEQSNIDLRRNAERGFAHEPHEIASKIAKLENARVVLAEQNSELRAALSAIAAELKTAKEGRDFWVKEANHYHVGRNEALAREERVRALVEKWRGMMVGLVSPGINTPGRQACLQELEAALAAQSEEE